MRAQAFLTGMVLIVGLAAPVAGQDSPALLGRDIDQWSEQFTSAEGPQRVHAAWAIAQLAGSQGGSYDDAIWFSELVKLISDRDPAVRYWGVLGLAKYGSTLAAKDGGRSAVRSTLHPLLEDKSAAVRISAAETIGAFGEPQRALPVLAAALQDSQEATRVQAVCALEKLGPAAQPAEEALRVAAEDNSEYVKRISQRWLERFTPRP